MTFPVKRRGLSFSYDARKLTPLNSTSICDFRTLAEHVDAARVPEYARNLERVRDDASYWFTTGTAARLPPAESMNIMLILAVLVGA